VAGATQKPVKRIGVSVDATPSRLYHKADFDLREDEFAFLFSFDFGSFRSRKNPEAVIEAFQRAFPASEGNVALVVKMTNSERAGPEVDALRRLASDDARVRLLERYVSRDEMYGLLSVTDSYVSLHRSEGFGLGLAEAMSLGKPVIGTAYSGNMDFMDASNSCLVGYRLIDVPEGAYPHFEGQVWADPDVEHAAYHMRRLVTDPSFAAGLGTRAKSTMATLFSHRAIGANVALGLADVASRRELLQS
jgi:glycosyltransferase involved in cell wall biosynthesis